MYNFIHLTALVTNGKIHVEHLMIHMKIKIADLKRIYIYACAS